MEPTTIQPNTEVHSVHDSESKYRQYLGERIEHTREVGERVNRDNVKLSDTIKPNDSHNIFNPQYQFGNIMATKEFETKLLTLNPNLILRFFPADENSAKFLKRKMIYIEHPFYNAKGERDIELEKITAYTHPIVPEHSILGHTEQVLYDANINHLDRSMFDKDGNDLTKRTGYAPFAEVIRGYRTVLALLVRKRLIRLNDAIKLFGDSSRQDWKFSTTGRNFNPWIPPS